MKSKNWKVIGSSIALITLSGCISMDALLYTEAYPNHVISSDRYGFEKYLTEQECSEWKTDYLLPAIKEICQPPYGALAPITGWPTNRISISEWSYFNLTEEERSDLVGVISLSAGDVMTYVFLPDYLYVCCYSGISRVWQVPYSALLERGRLAQGRPGDLNDISIQGFSISPTKEPLEGLEDIYAANESFLDAKNKKMKQTEKLAVKQAEEASEKVAKIAAEQKRAQLENEAKVVLEKNKKEEGRTISLKGIYIGMPVNDASVVLRYRLGILDVDDAAFYLPRISLDAKGGCLSLFAMDAGITMLFFGSMTITGEELAQQMADKYGITMEVDAYGRAWQYRDAKSGVKIQIGADGSILMEKIQSLLGDDDSSSELQKARNIADVEKAKGVLTLPVGVMPGAMGAGSDTAINSGVGLKNLLTALGIDDLSQLSVNGQDISIGDLNGNSAHY